MSVDNTSRTNPNIKSIFDAYVEFVFRELNCHHIGKIESFDKATQTATISLAYKSQTEYENEVKIPVAEFPFIENCPVVIASGGKGSIRFPITKGDYCLLCFNDVDSTNWIGTGSDGLLASKRKHSINDAFAIVGLFPKEKSLTDYDGERTELIHENTKISLKDKIRVKNNDANLYSILSELLALFNASDIVCGAYALTGPAIGKAQAIKSKLDLLMET